MAFIQGSVTDANPGPALYALMAPALTTAGYTLVDTVVISTRTHKVWKSAAANNTQGLDWYLDIGYTTTGAGTIAITAFEMFDPATDLAYRGPVGPGAGMVIDPTTFSRYGATGYALETNWYPNAGQPGTQTSLTTSTFGYWISATADRVILLSSIAASTIMYAGFYQPDPIYAAKAGASIHPLISGKVGGTSVAGTLNLNRLPPLTSVFWPNHAKVLFPYSPTHYPQIPDGLTGMYQFVAAPITIMVDGPGVGLSYSWGSYGTFRDVYQVSAAASVVRGDTCTIGGAPHVLSTSASSASYAMKAA